MTKKPLLMDLEDTLFLDKGCLVIIDRRKLPGEVTTLRCARSEEVARAIEDMAVQGAGDIAVAAGFGLYLEARALEKKGRGQDMEGLERAAERLRSTRPTGFHLALLLRRALERVGKDPREASAVILDYLEEVIARSKAVSEATGRHGETLLASGDTILTHCFPGPALLYMLKYAAKKGKTVRVVCTETRPYLQGAPYGLGRE